MTLPRQIIPGSFYMVTRRCTQRQFLLRPDEETNNVFLYCLAEAAARYGIDVILPVVLSNHHHTCVYDRHGTIAQFAQYLHRLVAITMNDLRGRNENLWNSGQPSYLRLENPEDVIDKIVYAATNPVNAHLVERVHQWPGVNGLSALLNGRPLTATRPRHFFSEAGSMPDEVTLELVIPPELGDAEVIRGILRERVDAIEEEHRAARAQTGARVVGRRAILAQSWRACAVTPEARGGLNPRIGARKTWSRVEALRRSREFLAAYRDAWERWRVGLPAIFPFGTYWLQRFANVTVAAAMVT